MNATAVKEQPQTKTNSCLVCNGVQIHPYLESNNRQILQCVDCGFLMVYPRPSHEQTKTHFEEEYIEDEDRLAVDFTAMRLHSLRREAKWLKELTHGGKLLDLGTASGAFLMEFKGDKNWQVEGVEPSRYAAAAAAKQTGFPVHAGFLLDQNFADESFDVVTSLDAFMLHPDPRADFYELARILKPGGLLAFEIPGLRFRLLKNSGLLCRLVYGIPAKLNAGVHLYYYSRSTLGKLASQFGLEEIAARPEQSPLYGPWYARAANWIHYGFSSLLYRLTGGKLSIVAKEFIVYRKVA